VTTFRGEEARLIDIYPPGTSQVGKGGRVYLGMRMQSLFFPGVIDAEFVEVETARPDVIDEPTEKLDSMRSVERQGWREKGYDD
jgi:hypothetical protein